MLCGLLRGWGGGLFARCAGSYSLLPICAAGECTFALNINPHPPHPNSKDIWRVAAGMGWRVVRPLRRLLQSSTYLRSKL